MMRPTIFRFRAGGRGGDTGYRLGLQVSLELRFWRLIFVARGARLALKSEQSACGVAELARTRDWLVRSHDPEKWDRFSGSCDRTSQSLVRANSATPQADCSLFSANLAPRATKIKRQNRSSSDT